jgi:hypothetical protein
LSGKPDKVEIQIKYGQLEQKIFAKPQDAWLMLNQFFKDALPSFELAKKIWLSVDLQKTAADLEGIVVFSSEGPNLLAPKGKLTDNEALSVWLLAQFVGRELGLVKEDALSKEELQMKLGKSGKITSTRLGELVKNDLVTKTADDKFKISSFGILQTQKDVLPKIRAKIKS